MTIHAATPDAFRLLLEGSLALAEIERNGIRIDTDYLDQATKKVAVRIKNLQEKMRQDEVWAVWQKACREPNMGSRTQLAKVLFQEMKFEHPGGETKTGRLKTDGSVLEKIDHPFVKRFLRVEKLKKAKSTYLEGLKREVVDGFVHPNFNLHLVDTFRSSADSPNVQNQPTRDPMLGEMIRRCYIPRKGNVLLEIDYCLSASTDIETIDGVQTITKVIDRVESGERVYVYGYDCQKGRVGVSEVLRGARTGKKKPVWKVTLDNGEVVIGTSDHKFMLRTGDYIPLRDLRPGMSLMPFYRQTKRSWWGTNYTKVYLNNGRSILAHNLIALDLFGVDIGGSNQVVHHWDGNGTNNSLENIEVMDRKRHMQIHARQGWNSPEGRRKHLFWNRSRRNRENVSSMSRNREWTEEDRRLLGEKISDSIRIRGGHCGKHNPMYGKRHSAKTRKKMARAKIGYVPIVAGWNKGKTKESDPRILAASLANTGRTAWNKGKKGVQSAWNKGIKTGSLSEEHKKKISVAKMGARKSSETRRRMSKAAKLRKRGPNGRFHNHKVVSVEFSGYEDVYNICVDKFHNFALSAGVIVKNSALEFRVAACFWKDPEMVRYIEEGRDPHRDFAALCYKCKKKEVSKETRFFAKNQFVFPILYGSYYKQCARNLWQAIDDGKLEVNGVPMKDHLKTKGIDRLGKCDPKMDSVSGTFEHHIREVEQKFNSKFSAFGQSKDPWYQEYRKKAGFPLLTGFWLSGLFSRNFCFNAPIQGPGFHCLLWSLPPIQKQLRKRKMATKIVAEIHDSGLFDAPLHEVHDVIALARQVMTVDVCRHWPWIIVPLAIEAECTEADCSWYTKKEKKKI